MVTREMQRELVKPGPGAGSVVEMLLSELLLVAASIVRVEHSSPRLEGACLPGGVGGVAETRARRRDAAAAREPGLGKHQPKGSAEKGQGPGPRAGVQKGPKRLPRGACLWHVYMYVGTH